MHFKYVAITFATYAVSKVLAAPVGSPGSDVTGLRVRAEGAPQAQQDANAQLNDNGNKDDQHYSDIAKQPETMPAYNQEDNVKPQSQTQQEGTQQPGDQKDEQDVKPAAEHPNNNEAAAPTYQQNTVDTAKDQNNKENEDQVDEQQMDAVDTKDQANDQESKDQMDDQQLDANANQPMDETQNSQENQMTSRPQTDRPMEEDQADDQLNNQQYAAPPSYNQGQGQWQGQGQGHRTGSLEYSPSRQGQRQQHPQQAPPSYYGGGGAVPYSVSPCDYDGEFLCNGLDLFGICDWGQVVWQPVAHGTACRNGAIGYAKKMKA